MTPFDLIKTARGLTKLSPRRPTQANLRRAVSTAYYAMFHCLASSAASLLVGGGRGTAWHQVYRTLEHGKAKNACQRHRAMQVFPAGIQDFAKAFVRLQTERHRADCALEGSRYYKSDVIVEIDAAERAIDQFERMAVAARRGFVVHVLFRQRPSQEVPR